MIRKRLKQLVRSLPAFRRNEGGNFAVIMAVCAVPIVAAVGVAVDYTRYSRMESNMQNAADAAALAAVGAKDELNNRELQKLVRDYFTANGGEAEVSRRTVVCGRETKTDVIVRARVRADAAIMHYFKGQKTQLIRVEARARKTDVKVPGVEVALVIENSHSMKWGASWSNIVDAVETAMTAIESETKQGELYMTLVPFTDRINIGNGRKSWLSKTDSMKDWEGCVEPLEVAKPGLPFYLELGNPNKSFLPTVPKYWGPIFTTKGHRDCADEIIGPTKSVPQIRNGLYKIAPKGDATGRFDDALAWGWRAVTKQWKGEWGAGSKYPSDDPEVQKLVAFFTDGHTNINQYEMEQKPGEFGNNNASKTHWAHFNNVCDRMKAEGIEVFIFHVIGNASAEPYMRQCAGDNYVKVTGSSDWVNGMAMLAERGTEGLPRLVK